MSGKGYDTMHTNNKNILKDISEIMKTHYEDAFEKHGPNSQGVDWGDKTDRMYLRYEKMLAVIDGTSEQRRSVLDVGCGYGGTYGYALEKGLDIQYTGIDIAENSIAWAKANMGDAEFLLGDFLEADLSDSSFDYVICNGILTQKIGASLLDMDYFAKLLIKKMFNCCSKGIAFNIMSTAVNFFAPNLYYRHPAEILTYCMSEISTDFRIDHSYGLYEFTVYLYKRG